MHSYLNKSENFSVRMSKAINSKSHADVHREDQQKLFVDLNNVDLAKSQHKHESKNRKGCCSCNFTPFILMVALSFHAFFEGIALGF